MRMDEMNKLFEEQGFEVERKWLTGEDCYEFHICKGVNHLVSKYVYPIGARGDVASAHQRSFVNEMIIRFEKYFKTKRIDSMRSLRDYILTAGHYHKPLVNKKLETSIKDVIFNPPATIVMWDDGTKTVVKAQGGDEFDAEKGLAMAISKKALGNDRKYYHTFIHWLKRYEKQNVKAEQDIKLPSLSEASANIHKLQQAIYEKFGMAKPGKVEKKRQCVQKAYDLLVKFRDTSDVVSVDEVIGYLGEALED